MTYYLLDESGNRLADDAGNELVTNFDAASPLTTRPAVTVVQNNGKRHVKMVGY